MKFLTSKTFLGGAAVFAVLAGLYFGYSHMSETSEGETTTTQNQEVTTPSVPTVPALNTEPVLQEKTVTPSVNAEEQQGEPESPKSDAVKNNSTD